LVLPLVSITFPNNGITLPAKLFAIRRHCTAAFTKSFKGKKDIELFADAEYYLTRPYSWTDEDHRNKVRQYANSLQWFLFGMTEEQESNDQNNKLSDGRGFYSVQEYSQHSQCAVFLAKELLRNQERLDVESSNRIYENSWSTTRVDSEAAMPVMPGSSLYIFVQSVPVAISMRWFIQCIVLAANVMEGGVPARFLAQLNSDTVDYNYVECQNYMDGIENYEVNGAKNKNVTLPFNKWLRTAPFLFTLLDSTDDSDTGMHALQINRDVLDTISYAIDQLQVMEIPDLVCVDTTDWNVLQGSLANIRDLDLWRYAAQDVESQRSKPGGFLLQLRRDGTTSIHKQVLDFLAADERQCHSAEYLTRTLSTILADSTEWHTVAYVPADADGCTRVLDWPSDCGLATAGDSQGKCFMRQ
jgi:hypothetical protein